MSRKNKTEQKRKIREWEKRRKQAQINLYKKMTSAHLLMMFGTEEERKILTND